MNTKAILLHNYKFKKGDSIELDTLNFNRSGNVILTITCLEQEEDYRYPNGCYWLGEKGQKRYSKYCQAYYKNEVENNIKNRKWKLIKTN